MTLLLKSDIELSLGSYIFIFSFSNILALSWLIGGWKF